MLTILARFFAVICAILFVPVTCMVIFLQAASPRLTQPLIYRDALVSARFYARFPALTGDAVTRVVDTQAAAGRPKGSGADNAKVAKLLHTLTPSDWETLLGAVIPPAYLQQQVEGSLDQFFLYLHSDTAPTAGRISLVEMKRRMAGPEAVAAYAKMLQTKPPCTDAQFSAADGLPIDCQPPADKMPQVLDNFRLVMRATTDQMPDGFEFYRDLSNVGQAGSTQSAIAQTRKWVQQFEWLGIWCPIVPTALLLLIALLAIRSLRGGLFWWGILCLLAGVIAAGLARSTVPVVSWISVHVIVPALPADPPALTLQTILDFLTAVVQPVMTAALHTAVTLALGGLVAIILGGFLKPPPPVMTLRQP